MLCPPQPRRRAAASQPQPDPPCATQIWETVMSDQCGLCLTFDLIETRLTEASLIVYYSFNHPTYLELICVHKDVAQIWVVPGRRVETEARVEVNTELRPQELENHTSAGNFSCNLETKPWFNKLFVEYLKYLNSNILIVLFDILVFDHFQKPNIFGIWYSNISQ